MIKVLIVEDELLLADLYTDMLTESGVYNVCCTARTIKEAVRCAEMYDPDLALIDVRLARGEFGTAIPSLLNDKVGILYSTGNAERLQFEGVKGHGCLTKPYSCDDLLRGMAIVLDLINKRKVLVPLPRNFMLLPEGAQRLAA